VRLCDDTGFHTRLAALICEGQQFSDFRERKTERASAANEGQAFAFSSVKRGGMPWRIS